MFYKKNLVFLFIFVLILFLIVFSANKTPEEIILSHVKIQYVEIIGSSEILVHLDNKMKFLVNKNTYIGNYTKSPPKPLSYLKVGVYCDINGTEMDKSL